jgi:hypothetical protein
VVDFGDDNAVVLQVERLSHYFAFTGRRGVNE